MIRFEIGFVLLIRDGFTGKPVTESAVRIKLDGAAFRPEYRTGGYFVFVNMAAQPHEVVIQAPGFQEERIDIPALTGLAETAVLLRPNARYPFGRSVAKLLLKTTGKPAAGKKVWIAMCGAANELKIAQDDSCKGDESLRLFYRGGSESDARRFPGNYLICNGAASEVTGIRSAKEQCASLAKPLQNTHLRGVALYPAQAFTFDDSGELRAFYREAGELIVFEPERSKLTPIALKEGENAFVLKG